MFSTQFSKVLERILRFSGSDGNIGENSPVYQSRTILCVSKDDRQMLAFGPTLIE